MSGRVRWEQSWDRVRLVDPPRGQREQVADLQSTGQWYAHDVSDASAPTLRTRRRSDAKRWLLARAAGLAEVPRWQRVKRGGVEDGDARRPPKGWRRLTTVEIGGDPVSVYERNRRRR